MHRPNHEPSRFFCRRGRPFRQATLVFALTMAALALPVSRHASAQDGKYKEIEPTVTRSEASTLTVAQRKVLRSSDAFQDGENRKKFDSYYTDWVFPLMTRQSPEGLAELGKTGSFWTPG